MKISICGITRMKGRDAKVDPFLRLLALMTEINTKKFETIGIASNIQLLL